MGDTVYNLSNEEKEINEWTRRSRNEGICGIVNCYHNKPTTQCKNAPIITVQNIFPLILPYYQRQPIDHKAHCFCKGSDIHKSCHIRIIMCCISEYRSTIRMTDLVSHHPPTSKSRYQKRVKRSANYSIYSVGQHKKEKEVCVRSRAVCRKRT